MQRNKFHGCPEATGYVRAGSRKPVAFRLRIEFHPIAWKYLRERNRGLSVRRPGSRGEKRVRVAIPIRIRGNSGMGEEFGWRQWTREKGKERKRLACFQWCRSLRSNCAYRSVLLSRQRSQCPLPLLLFGRGRVVRRGSARCTQCLRASRSTSLYPAARCSRGPYYHCKSSFNFLRGGNARDSISIN